MLNPLDLKEVFDLVGQAVEEDLGRGDVTSRAVVRSGNTFLGDGSATIKSGDNYFRDGTTTRAVGNAVFKADSDEAARGKVQLRKP